MKANEFVKKFGWDKAGLLLSTQGKTIESLKVEYTSSQLKEFQRYIVSDRLMNLDKLKHLVESHELVEKHGGLISARKYIKFLRSSVDIGLYHGLDDVDCKTEIPLIEQAIKDVESCL